MKRTRDIGRWNSNNYSVPTFQWR